MSGWNRFTVGSALGVFFATAALAQGGALKEEERAAHSLILPSGLEAGLQEVRREGESPEVVRARYVAPEFRPEARLEAITADLEYLCAEHVLAVLEPGEGAQVIVSLSDAPSEFGVANPEISQVFEAFTVKNGLCIWEAF